jgi:cancer susceptibility candidate protein 1
VIHPIKLKKKVFHQQYRTPGPPKPGQRRLPEEIEAEIKLMEENLEKLVLVNVE